MTRVNTLSCRPAPFFLPVLREAPVVTTLRVPAMSRLTSRAAASVIKKHRLRLESLAFEHEGIDDAPGDHQPFVDIVRDNRETLHFLDVRLIDPNVCESMLRALLPDDTDLRLQTNLQQIEIVLDASPTVSVLIQRILTNLRNLRTFVQDMWTKFAPGRLEIRDLMSGPWECVGLEYLCICLGCHTAEDNATETGQERWTKISQVYKLVSALTT